MRQAAPVCPQMHHFRTKSGVKLPEKEAHLALSKLVFGFSNDREFLGCDELFGEVYPRRIVSA